jgi:hypothetical protein
MGTIRGKGIAHKHFERSLGESVGKGANDGHAADNFYFVEFGRRATKASPRSTAVHMQA